jgi:hypothetical protein
MSQDNTPDTTPEPEALADLELQAAALEGAGQAQQQQRAQQQQEQQQQQDQATIENMAGELRQALGMLRLMAAPAFAWWPHFGECWSDRQLDAIAQAGAAVMQRQGLTMGDLFAQWGPYIALVTATAPPAIATYAAIKHRKAQAEQGPSTAGERLQPSPDPAP